MLYGGWVVFVDMFMVLMELSLRKGLLSITVFFQDDAFFGYVCTAKGQSAHLHLQLGHQRRRADRPLGGAQP